MSSLARSVPKPLKVPSLARSVSKPLKVPSLSRSVPKPLKVLSLARFVPKPLKVVDFFLRFVRFSLLGRHPQVIDGMLIRVTLRGPALALRTKRVALVLTDG